MRQFFTINNCLDPYLSWWAWGRWWRARTAGNIACVHAQLSGYKQVILKYLFKYISRRVNSPKRKKSSKYLVKWHKKHRMSATPDKIGIRRIHNAMISREKILPIFRAKGGEKEYLRISGRNRPLPKKCWRSKMLLFFFCTHIRLQPYVYFLLRIRLRVIGYR